MRTTHLALFLLALSGPVLLAGCSVSCTASYIAPPVDARLNLPLPTGVTLEGAAITVLLDGVSYAHQSTLVVSLNEDVVRCEKTPNTLWKWECSATQSKRVLEVELRLPEQSKVAIEIAITPVGGPRTVLYKAVGASTTRQVEDQCGDGIEYTWTLKETLTSS